MATKKRKFESLRDLYKLCEAGNVKAKRVCILLMESISADDHLDFPGHRGYYWQRCYSAIETEISDLIDAGCETTGVLRSTIKHLNTTWDKADLRNIDLREPDPSQVFKYTPAYDKCLRNTHSLPRGLGAKFLLCIKGPVEGRTQIWIAKQWIKCPEKINDNEAIFDFSHF